MEKDIPGDWRLIELGEVDSTQMELRRRLTIDCDQKWVVRCDRQQDGRGRRDRKWSSPMGGLWCSLTLRPGAVADPFSGVMLALAARDAIAGLLGSEGRSLALKWPNDLIVGGAKWGGVLAEVEQDPRGRPIVLLGLGLNLVISSEELTCDPLIPTDATSILEQFGRSPSPPEALSRILQNLDQLLEEERIEGGRDRIRLRIAEVLDTLGRQIRWRDGSGEERRGEAVGLASDGGLEVEVSGVTGGPSSTRVVLRSAEVSHLRPAERESS